jgi:poly-gamma-glutamate system protein
MLESGVDSSSTVGVILSGSFPSLGIATLAALQTIGAEAIVISSLGASSFGANQPEATWIDLESMLRQDVGLQYRSTIVTLGAENDKGEGIQAEGVALMEQAANRCGIALMRPSSLDESIRLKSELLLNAQIDLLVNIGGNEAAIGKCSDAAIIPNGLQPQWAGCLHSERGIIARIAEHHVPFIHLLNIKGLAARYGMPIGPGPSIPESTDLYVERTANPVGPVLGLLAVFGLLTGNRVKQNRTIRAENAREKEDFSENK